MTQLERSKRFELSRAGLTLSVDSKAPGTDLNRCPLAMRRRWFDVGWAHFTLSRDDVNWGTRGKIVDNGSFLPLPEVQEMINLFERGAFDKIAA